MHGIHKTSCIGLLSAFSCSGGLVSCIKEFSLLRPRSAPLLIKAVVRKAKREGLTLLSLVPF